MTDFDTIMNRVREHYNEAKLYFPEDRIVGIFLQGSQNYGLDLPTSDVDTKLIVVPTFKDIALNRKPVSTTHVRAMTHCFKDEGLLKLLKNLNSLKFLFRLFYFTQWNRLVGSKLLEPYRAVKSEGYCFIPRNGHPYPTKLV